jgi:hypothetical protein
VSTKQLGGQSLYTYTEPHNLEKRVQLLEDEFKRFRRATGIQLRGEQAPQGNDNTSGNSGVQPLPIPEIASIVQADGYTLTGIYNPYATVVIDGSTPLAPGFKNFRLRLTYPDGSAHEVDGPILDYDSGVDYDTCRSIVVKQIVFATLEITAKVITLYGEGPWGPVATGTINDKLVSSLNVIAPPGTAGTYNLFDDMGALVGYLGVSGEIVTHDAAVILYAEPHCEIFITADKNISLGVATGVILISAPDLDIASTNTTTINVGGDLTIGVAGRAYYTADTHFFSGGINADSFLTFSTANITNINTSGQFLVSMTGDEYGGFKFYGRNRTGENGCILELVPDDSSIQLMDLILKHPGGQKNIRLEGRSGNCFLGTGQEFQFGPAGDADIVLSAAGLLARRGGIFSQATDSGFKQNTSTGALRDVGGMQGKWLSSTDSTRTGQVELIARDWNNIRIGFTVEADGTNPKISFFGGLTSTKQTVTGSRGGNAALASLLTALATYGLIVDSST